MPSMLGAGTAPPPRAGEAGCLSVLGTQCLVGEDTTEMTRGWAGQGHTEAGDRKEFEVGQICISGRSLACCRDKHLRGELEGYLAGLGAIGQAQVSSRAEGREEWRGQKSRSCELLQADTMSPHYDDGTLNL